MSGPGEHLSGLTNVRLDPADIDAIAQRVVVLMREQPSPQVRLVDAATLAERLGVERDWVYAHAKELHGVRLGGPRGRLRFDMSRVLRSLGDEGVPAGTPPRRRSAWPGGELLPIDP
jgi:hypothetical protein